ncbi:nuclear transcription factor y subunit a-3 [Phtheirospermum japonicum]|uniref:Nuclear transcription factor Y subunit n=1 Tax=Phtheirospermum japonicum TaxID=374723 RepID=A0A830BBM8_9LAMI|nr:nuclear transcription factor y subunit a-3 [Phtheirospermum japonicum]
MEAKSIGHGASPNMYLYAIPFVNEIELLLLFPDSAHDESYGKHGCYDMKAQAPLFLHNPELSMDVSQAKISQPIVQFPYAYADPYFSGLYTAYGPHNMVQPQVMAATAGRIPLPADIREDGPIYVNAKQYHGILRRRQTRAKLEAQNKLVKNRKPYLHESRHQHALNRVRGTGGRFLSTKKGQQSDSQFNEHQVEADKYNSAPSGMTRVSTADHAILQQQQQQDGRFSSHTMAVPMEGSGGLVYNGKRHYASIVRANEEWMDCFWRAWGWGSAAYPPPLQRRCFIVSLSLDCGAKCSSPSGAHFANI